MQASLLNENFAASPQIQVEHLAQIKAAGFNVIVCNRPDGEDAGQPTFASIADAAEKEGLKSFHIPMYGPEFTAEDQDKLKEIIDTPEAKVFAYCRSGNRSSILWKATQG